MTQQRTTTEDASTVPTVPTVAIVLAAGGGTRWDGDGHKLLADLDGAAIVTHAVRAALHAAIGPVLVVVGATALPDLPDGVELVENPRWETGQASSLAAGIARAEELGAGAAVVGLGDQPRVGPGAWRAVAAIDAPIVVATFDGERRPPVRLAREVWASLPATGDEGARALWRGRPDLVTAVACAGDATDVDRTEDLRRWS